MNDLVTAVLLVAGAGFGLIAAIGVVRMPDTFTRMHPATKTGTLGVGCIVLAVLVHFGTIEIAAQALLIIAFLFLTAPVAAHMIGRAAYFVGVPTWEKTVIDELEGQYDRRTHALESPTIDRDPGPLGSDASP
jgi:multicomponent Na+:H+ antiporter subunit G